MFLCIHTCILWTEGFYVENSVVLRLLMSKTVRCDAEMSCAQKRLEPGNRPAHAHFSIVILRAMRIETCAPNPLSLGERGLGGEGDKPFDVSFLTMQIIAAVKVNAIEATRCTGGRMHPKQYLNNTLTPGRSSRFNGDRFTCKP